eukprot:TRINITY_DN17750_c0_g1_i1.p1 TRINITY_DN17750_c0_g1~~TRINITY_DN17750_c0_g1_i1.p1  ORF type:complete len:184 (+),score=46.67 TRINITY_DN17750_c0_g1_i1:72-554(+)
MNYLLKNGTEKQHVKLLLDCLLDTEPGVVKEVMDVLKVIAKKELEKLIDEKEIQYQYSETPTLHDILFPESTWHLAIDSSINLLSELMAKKYHEHSNNSLEKLLNEVQQDRFLPSCRVHQCRHLPSILSLLEVPIPGMQLLTNLLLSDITHGDNFSKRPS